MNNVKVGCLAYVPVEVTEVRHNGTIIVRDKAGDYFGVARSCVKSYPEVIEEREEERRTASDGQRES